MSENQANHNESAKNQPASHQQDSHELANQESAHPNSAATAGSGTAKASSAGGPVVLYKEQQWVPWYWWLLGAAIVALTTGQLAHNRSIIWLFGPAIVLGAIAVWVLLSLSSTKVRVEQEPDGTRFLVVGQANLPHTAVSRALVVPASSKQTALGRYFDPAAYLVSHAWVKDMAMFVISEEDEDPTPYWLISSRNPQALIQAFLPDSAQHQPTQA